MESSQPNLLPQSSLSLRLPSGLTLRGVEQGSGSGTPVLFLHGFCDSWRSWQGILERLSATFHAYALSFRGHGDSDKPPTGYRPTDFATDIIAALDLLTLPRITLIGHSMGAYAASLINLMHPECVEAIALVGWGPAHPHSTEAANRVREMTSMVEHTGENRDASLVKKLLRNATANALPESLEGELFAESMKVPVYVWKEVLLARLNERPTHLDDSATPALVLYGEHDVYRHEGTALFRTVYRNAQYVTLAGAGHSPHWEQPEQVAQAIKTFLAPRQASTQ